MPKEKTYRGYAVGREIVTFKRGSWQEAAHAKGKGMRFFEPVPPADRLERTPAEAEQITAHAGELLVLEVCAQAEEMTEQQPPKQSTEELALAS